RRVSATAEPLDLHVVSGLSLSGNGTLVWTGSSYLLAASEYSDVQKIVGLRLDRHGEQSGGTPFSLGAPGTPGVVNIPTLVSNGRQTALAWTQGIQLQGSGF